MKNEAKQKYESPRIEVIRMESEGLMVGSGGNGSLNGVGNGGSAFSTSSYRATTRSYSTNTSDFEDMINDILTFEGQ